MTIFPGRRIISAREIATQAGDLDRVGAEYFPLLKCLAFIVDKLVQQTTSVLVKATLGGASGAERLIIVIQKMRQLRMQKAEIKFTSRSAVLSFDSSALHPDLRSLWKTSIFHRIDAHGARVRLLKMETQSRERPR